MIVGGNYTIDFAKVSNIPKFAVGVKVGDSKRKISLTLLENNMPINLNYYNVVVACKKSDGNDIFNTVIKTDAVNGKCEVEITNQMLVLDTDLPCEIVLYGSNGTVATSSNFVIGRISSVRDEKNVVSSSEFTALTNALSQVAKFDSRITEIENKGTTVEVLERVTKEEIDRQIADGTIANLTIADNSITEDKIKNGTITLKSLNSELFMSGTEYLNVKVNTKSNRFRYMVQVDTGGERTKKAYIKVNAKINKGNITNSTYLTVKLYGNNSDNLENESYGVINEYVYDKVIMDSLGTEFSLSHEYEVPTTNSNANNRYIVFCLEFTGLTGLTDYDIDIEVPNIKINDKNCDINKHESYFFDFNTNQVTGDLSTNSPLVRKADVVDILKDNKKFDVLLNSKYKTILDGYFEPKLPSINYNGATTDSMGLFTVLMFDIRQILDTYPGYMTSNVLSISFNANELVNTRSMGTQLFNNNNPNLSTIEGGELIGKIDASVLDGKCSYSRKFENLKEYQYIRLCINAAFVNAKELQSGILSDFEIYLGDIDLTPYLYEINGLPHNSEGYEFILEYENQIPSRSYVDQQISAVNERIDNLNVSSDGTIIGTSSKWKNKKWCAVGDSITEKNFRANKNYHDYIKEDIGCIVENRGISGSGYQASNAIMNRISTCASDSELITVFAGTNDYNHGTVELGNVGDKTESTLCGCIYLTFERLLNRFPTKTIAVFTALPRSNCYPLNEVENDRGYTLGQLAKATKDIAELFGFPVLDLYHASNLHPWITANNTYYFAYQNDGVSAGDGLHPNDKGQKVIANKIKHFINSL